MQWLDNVQNCFLSFAGHSLNIVHLPLGYYPNDIINCMWKLVKGHISASQRPCIIVPGNIDELKGFLWHLGVKGEIVFRGPVSMLIRYTLILINF